MLNSKNIDKNLTLIVTTNTDSLGTIELRQWRE